MKKARLNALADGIFAIVMTLLVLELSIPHLAGQVPDVVLTVSLLKLMPSILTYILSFLVLFTYWMAHHYMMSLIARNLTRTLTYLNIPFLMFVALIPFSTRLLGEYWYSNIAIMTYGLNIALIALSLLLISKYIEMSQNIRTNPEFTERDFQVSYIRTMIPLYASVMAILISFWSPKVAIFVFIFSIMLNLIPPSLHVLLQLFGWEQEFEKKLLAKD